VSRRRWIVLLTVCVLAVATCSIARPRQDQLQFLDPYRVGERTLYQDYKDSIPQQTRHVTVKIDRGELKRLLVSHCSVDDGWKPKVSQSHFDADGYEFRAVKGTGSILEQERITCIMTDYKNYKNEYIVFHSKPMTRFEVLLVRIKNIGRDPFRRD
jgi:hypothetical protein